MKLQYASAEVLAQLVEDLRHVEAGRLSESDFEGSPMLLNPRVVPSPVGFLSGIVEGHPKLRTGQEITTSQVYFIDTDRGIARTLSRWYRLHAFALNGGH